VAAGARTSAVEMLRNADIAMYSAKQRRKGGYQVFEPGMQRAAVRRLQIKADLERALDRGEFSLRYQPLVALDNGEIRGVEALLRWEHPRRGVVLPAEFIGLAEESGLIVPIGRWVLGEACRQAHAWQHEGGPRLGLNVNLSAKQLLDPGLTADVAEALARSGLDPSLLTLEITESILMNDTAYTTTTLDRLKALGARIAIDDFGTGYSSLSYLRRFPIDGLKIDQSFVAALERGGEETAIVSSILALSRTLNLETVAEGVENVIQATRLRAMGGDLAQGYYFARPLAAADLAVLLQQGGAEGRLALPA
jgi:EAL domain-containing protein (putative c-di-GMP-specific phosphodiesterase class I)